jgi:hypothetical protein
MRECHCKKLHTQQAYSSAPPITHSKPTLAYLESRHHRYIVPISSQNLPFIILAPPLTPRPNLLAGKIPRPLKHAAFPELAANGIINAVLEPVDVLVARDFRFREVVCRA